MAWVKLDDQFPMHPKMVEAGGDAAWLHVCALCYCAQHLTDGMLPKAIVDRLSDRKNPARLAARLVEVGAWIDRGDVFELHGFLEFNRSREEVVREREAAKERRAKGGKKSAEGRQSVARTSADVRANDMNPDPTPSEEPDGSSAKAQRDALFDALVDVFGPATMRSRASHYGKCVTELLANDVAPDDVRHRGAVLKAKFDTPSPEALMRWWDELDQPGFATNGRRDPLAAAKALISEGVL